MSSSDSRGSLLDGFRAGDGLDSLDDIMKNNWDQSGVDASQLGTTHNHGVFNPGSMHVEPHQLPPHQGTSQPSNIANAADAEKAARIRESKRKSREKKETGRKENEKRLAEVTKENCVLLEANARLEKEVKIKQKKDEQELSNFNEEVSRLNNKLEGQTMQQFYIAEMVVKINEGQERIRAEMVKINEGQERMRAEMVKINEGQERIRAGQKEGQKEERIRAGQRGLKRIRAEMVGTNKAQERIRAGQKEESIRRDLKRIRAEMVLINEAQKRIRAGQKESAKPKEETNEISKLSIANQVKLDLMFQIVKARSENDAPKVAALTQILRELMNGKRAEHPRRSKNKD